MAIKSAGYLSASKTVEIGIHPPGGLVETVVVVISGEGKCHRILMPESEWRRLCRETCGEPTAESQWQPGLPAQPGRYVVQSKDDPLIYGLATVPSTSRTLGGSTIDPESIVRHFRIPDPPQAKVPEPPKWVRMKCLKHHQNFVPGELGWGFRQLKLWHIVPDSNQDNWMYNAVVNGGEWAEVDG
jgi:hypothetical protein